MNEQIKYAYAQGATQALLDYGYAQADAQRFGMKMAEEKVIVDNPNNTNRAMGGITGGLLGSLGGLGLGTLASVLSKGRIPTHWGQAVGAGTGGLGGTIIGSRP